MRRLLSSLVVLCSATGLFVAAALAASGGKGAPQAARGAIQEGGTLTIGAYEFDFIDPALALPQNAPFSVASWPVEDATCAYLLRYPAGPPTGVRYNLVPEVATAYPALSRDGKTYTFTIRKGFRFSTGAPVTAQSYADAINRLLNPAIRRAYARYLARANARPSNLTLDTPAPPAATYLREVVGSAAVRQGKARTASGVKVVGSRLIIRLTKRAPDFPARMTMPYFCPVAADLPVSSEGVSAPLPGSGPYYIAEFVRGSRVVLERNSYYRGTRPHHVDRFVVEVGDFSPITTRKVEADERDIDLVVGPAAAVTRIVPKYGINKSRFFAFPSPTMFYLVMNTSRPLFKNNLKLRQAVNFVTDRAKLMAAQTGGVTAIGLVSDDYLPPMTPGYVDGHVYPFEPDLEKARALARGNTRSGKAVMYVCDIPGCAEAAQVHKDDLKQIGIEVELKGMPDAVAVAKVATRGEGYDLVGLRHLAVYVDPSQIVDYLFDGRTIRATGNTNISYFNSAHYNRLIERAGRLSGNARYAAYGRLAVDIARNAAPVVGQGVRYQRFFLSSHVGCVQAAAHGGVDLAGLCLK
jgi:peptide/nickel transport system substrate-binding protein